MIPADIGLPAKFTTFRQGQLDAAINIASSEKRFVLDCQPTGAGKSIIYMAVHRLLEARTLVVTANKGLQQQLSADFTPIGLVDIRGQANYPCVALESRPSYHGCDKGPCHFGAECELHPRHPEYRAGCHFYDALNRIRKSRLCVTNYDFWMSANRYMDVSILGKFDLLVLDEAHEAPDKLSEFCSVKLTEDECQEYLECGLPPIEDGVEAWVNWAIDKGRKLKGILEYAKQFHSDDTDHIFELTKLANRIEFLTTAHVWQSGEPADPDVIIPGKANDWVAERIEQGAAAIFSPVWAHRYAEQWLFAGIPKVVMVSATILPQTAKYLGIEPDQFDYQQHQSQFPIARRPIYIIPSASISSKSRESDYRAQMIKIDQVIGGRLDRKGIIQPHSYDRAYQVRMASRYKNQILWHKRGEVQKGVDSFKRAQAGAFISPAIEQGFDFPYQECEYNIIAKIPFPDTRSAVMKARCRSDRRYQNYLTVIKLIQMAGRGMRAADDFCEIFIFDDNIYWFLQAAKDMIPKWFRAAFRRQDVLPPVPEKLAR